MLDPNDAVLDELALVDDMVRLAGHHALAEVVDVVKHYAISLRRRTVGLARLGNQRLDLDALQNRHRILDSGGVGVVEDGAIAVSGSFYPK